MKLLCKCGNVEELAPVVTKFEIKAVQVIEDIIEITIRCYECGEVQKITVVSR